MRAFKQFLSLVLVTCMLTSMFTIVSAVGPTMNGQVWDSDSGHVLIKQGESGQSVDSRYVKYADSNYVKVELDENGTVGVDLTSGKEDVTVTLTGENLAGSFDLKVLDTGKNLVYAPEKASKVTENTPAEDESDNQKITFAVPPISMAGGSMLAVYPTGSKTPAWEISYHTSVKGSLTADKDTPAKIPTVSEEGSTSVTVPAAAVEAVLENVGEKATEAYVQVEASDENGSLLLDTSVFNHDKFKDGSFTLNITVKVGEISYTWKFTAKSAQTFALLAETRGDDSQKIDLMPKIVKDKFGDNQIPGEKVTIDVSKLSDDMIAELTVPTAVASNEVKVFSYEQETWVDGGVKSVAEGSVTFKVSKAASEYAIVASDVTAEQMNKEGGSDQEKPPVEETHDYKVTIDQANATVEVGKTTTLTATVTDKGEKITEGYTIQWKVTPGTGSATVDAKGVVTGGTKGTVTVEATATIGKDIVTSAPITVNVTSKGSTTPPTTGGSSSSGGGGGSWNDGSHGSSMPSAGSGTTTTPGTGTTTPGTGTSGNAQPQGCVSDTVGNFSVKGSYQYKLTSTNGQAPAVTVSNSNFRVVLASQNGKDYFFKVYAVGAVGQTCDVLVNGTKVSTVTASEVYGGVSCDTTAPFTVKKGGSYQFKLTASSKPVMAAGSSSFRVEYVGNSGNDWFFKVYAVGNAGDGCGFYVNGAPFTVAVAHIGE